MSNSIKSKYKYLAHVIVENFISETTTGMVAGAATGMSGGVVSGLRAVGPASATPAGGNFPSSGRSSTAPAKAQETSSTASSDGKSKDGAKTATALPKPPQVKIASVEDPLGNKTAKNGNSTKPLMKWIG